MARDGGRPRPARTGVDSSQRMAGRSVRGDAGSHSLIRRARAAGTTAGKLDQILEVALLERPQASGARVAAAPWDRRLRDSDSYEEKWEYIRNNPVRHKLVTRAEDWPYQGELNVLKW